MAELLTSKDMQDLLQVDRSTIYRMAESGRLPAIKVGKQWRFPSEQVDGWLQKKSAASPGPALELKAVSSNPVTCDLASLLPLQCVQLIQDTFADMLGLMVVVTDMQGQPVTMVSHPCGLFAEINKVPGAIQKCVESWHKMAMALEIEPKFRPSHLGLLCARGLIRVGTELRGMVVVAGIAPQQWPPSPEHVERMAAEFGVAADKLAAHLDEVFYLDEAEQARVLPFVQKIADIIAHIIGERNSLMGKLDAIADLMRK